MVAGYKTGGRRPGSKNKPKVSTEIETYVVSPVATAPPAAPPGAGVSFATRTRAREADNFPPHRIARVAELIPFEGNARTHSPASIDKLAKLITEFGWTSPILVAGRNIIAGHARRLAALKLGWDKVPVIDLKHLSPLQREACILADNRAALDGGWDDGRLADAFERLRDGGFNLEFTAFEPNEWSSILGDESSGGQTDPDDVPSTPSVPVSLLGDVWVMGKHRLLCGDCTQPSDIARVMGETLAVLMNTDPPYGVDYAAVKNGIPRSGFKNIQRDGGDIVNDNLTDGASLQAFLESAIRAAVPHLIDRAAFYFWHPMLTQGTFFAAAAAAAADILIHRQIIWVKKGFVLTRSGMYHWRHELCFYGWRRGNVPAWLGNKSQSSVWDDLRNDGGDHEHPTQKPVELFERPILNHSKSGEAIYEPFSGSGSQIIAAEIHGRACHAIEIEPRYIDVAVKRWQAFTGQQATLESTGRTFAETEASRTAPAKPARVKTRVKVAA